MELPPEDGRKSILINVSSSALPLASMELPPEDGRKRIWALESTVRQQLQWSYRPKTVESRGEPALLGRPVAGFNGATARRR